VVPEVADGVVVAGSGDDCPDADCSDADGVDHGGSGEVGVADGSAVGNHVVAGSNGFPTGRDGRGADLVAPADRSNDGLNELVLGSPAWVVAEPCPRNGTKNQIPVSTTRTAARAPSLRCGSRRRLCRGPELRT